MATTTVDLPVTYARIQSDTDPDVFVTTLGDEDETGETVLIVTGGSTHIYPIKFADGPDETVVLPDPPPGVALTKAIYVVKAYRETDTGGGDSSDFGYNPNPDDAPFLLADTSAHPVIDHLPIGDYDGIIESRGVTDDLSALASATAGNFSGDAWVVGNITGGGFTGGVIHVAYMALRLFYETPDLPCDTWVDLDLSTAVFLDNSGTLSGQYVDGVICTTIDGLYPDFYFPDLALDPAKPYKIEVTYDPDSAHTSGAAREVYVAGLRPGHEQDDTDAAYTAGGEYSGAVAVWYDTNIGATADVQTFIVGSGRSQGPIVDDFPSLPTWDDGTLGVAAGYTAPWFETDRQAGVSAIRIRKLCTFAAPPLRLTNRRDGLAGTPSLTNQGVSRQGGNRLTGYL